jgi:ABC-type uncharacterized transport system permease subunit
MRNTFRRAIQVASATLFLMVAGTTAAFAGPAPIAPEFPPPAADPQPVTSDGFPWMLTSVVVLLAVITVAAIAVLLGRTRTGHDSGLVTP